MDTYSMRWLYIFYRVRQDVNFSSKLEMVAEVMYLINHKGYEVQVSIN